MKNCILFLSLVFALTASEKVLPQEPLSAVKSYLVKPQNNQEEEWKPLIEGFDNLDMKNAIEKEIQSLLHSRVFLLALKEQLSVLNLPKDTNLNSTFSIPYPNILTLISTSLPILFEGLPSEVILKKLKVLMDGRDLVIPNNLQSATFLELINKVPQYSRDQIGLVNEMNVQGRTALQFVNEILGNSAKGAWLDALWSLSLDNAVLTQKPDIEATLNDLYQFVKQVLLDLSTLPTHPIEKLPYDRGENYAFGWWLNCDRKGICLLNTLPSDTIISFSPALRMYVINSLQVGIVIANTVQLSHNTRTFNQILQGDNEIFEKILYMINPSTSTLESKSSTDTEEDNLVLPESIRFVFKEAIRYFYLYWEFTSRQHILIRSLFWMVFIVVNKVFVYWGVYLTWFCVKTLIKRTHEPRPKLNKKD